MTTTPLEFVTPTEADLPQMGVVLSRAFDLAPEGALDWVREGIGLENARVLREGGVVVATSMRVPMGIWLGGRSVRQVGIAGVAVAPEARGRGLAREIMRRCLVEMDQQGEPISTLYSAMHPLYRSVGYETSGQLFSARVPAGMILTTDRGADWRPFVEADMPGVKACNRQRARFVQGALDRGPYLWKRAFKPKAGPAEAYVAEDASGRIEAYCVYRVTARSDGPASGNARGKLMDVVDFGYLNGHGLDRVMGFLRGFSSVVGEIDLADHPGSPLLSRLPDRRFAMSIHDPWMLRVVNVARAIEARGYAEALSCAFVMHVHDSLIEGNNQPLHVRIHGGKAETREAQGANAIELDVRYLAPILTGMQSATQLASLGLVRGEESETAKLDGAFACTGGPCMFDFF
jgi:predicted acetyltransferase